MALMASFIAKLKNFDYQSNHYLPLDLLVEEQQQLTRLSVFISVFASLCLIKYLAFLNPMFKLYTIMMVKFTRSAFVLIIIYSVAICCSTYIYTHAALGGVSNSNNYFLMVFQFFQLGLSFFLSLSLKNNIY